MIQRYANHRCQDHGVIGWISNTDVMTLGMIVMFALALFLQAKYVKIDAKFLSERERLSSLLKAKDAELARLVPSERLYQDAQVERERLSSLLKAKDAELARLVPFERLYQDLVGKIPQQKQVNREMIGLRGDLIKTVIIVDSSASMNSNGRWKDAVNVMEIWLDKLPMEQALVIVFSTDSHAFPADGRFLSLSGTDAATNREVLIEHLKATRPTGGTFTRGALERAYQYDGIDSIILFTDGAPNTGMESHLVKEEAEKIYKLIGEHKNIPINAVGLGNYFDPDMSSFLLKVGSMSGGTFIGR